LTEEVELARYYDENKKEVVPITITDYNKFIVDKYKEKIADFIYNRYIKPFEYDDATYREQYKNSFSMMANYCLLIETLQSFKNGWGDSNRKVHRIEDEY